MRTVQYTASRGEDKVRYTGGDNTVQAMAALMTKGGRGEKKNKEKPEELPEGSSDVEINLRHPRARVLATALFTWLPGYRPHRRTQAS